MTSSGIFFFVLQSFITVVMVYISDIIWVTVFHCLVEYLWPLAAVQGKAMAW
jgi:hypothetical protein